MCRIYKKYNPPFICILCKYIFSNFKKTEVRSNAHIQIHRTSTQSRRTYTYTYTYTHVLLMVNAHNSNFGGRL